MVSGKILVNIRGGEAEWISAGAVNGFEEYKRGDEVMTRVYIAQQNSSVSFVDVNQTSAEILSMIDGKPSEAMVVAIEDNRQKSLEKYKEGLRNQIADAREAHESSLRSDKAFAESWMRDERATLENLQAQIDSIESARADRGFLGRTMDWLSGKDKNIMKTLARHAQEYADLRSALDEKTALFESDCAKKQLEFNNRIRDMELRLESGPKFEPPKTSAHITLSEAARAHISLFDTARENNELRRKDFNYQHSFSDVTGGGAKPHDIILPGQILPMVEEGFVLTRAYVSKAYMSTDVTAKAEESPNEGKEERERTMADEGHSILSGRRDRGYGYER